MKAAQSTQTPWLHPILKAKKLPNPERLAQCHYAQTKLDGWRCTFFHQAKGEVYAFGKRQHMSLEFLTRFAALRDHPVLDIIRKLPPRSSIDCEIVASCRESTITALKSYDPSKFNIYAFAVPFLDGDDRRADPLTWAESFCKEVDLPFANYHVLKGESVDDLLTRSQQLGTEGWVLKSREQYGHWYKLKHEPEVDAFITATTRGKGKFEGLIGSIAVTVLSQSGTHVEIANVSGMTDAEREQMTVMEKNGQLMMSTVEIRYQRLGSQGRLIHPRFIRFRPDKQWNDCQLEQLY